MRKAAAHFRYWLPAVVNHLAQVTIIIQRLACIPVLMTRMLTVSFFFSAHIAAAGLH